MMEAANKGADQVNGKSIALGISLPFEQGVNKYATPDLSFEFHYFFVRKFYFLYHAKAVIVFPGGFGGAKNLSDFAVRGPDAEVNDSVSNAVRSAHAMGKPIGFICITPASVGALTLGGEGVKLTIGNDADTASAVTKCGAEHQDCKVDDVVIDSVNKVVSTPAYMLGPGVADVRKGISRLISEVLKLTS